MKKVVVLRGVVLNSVRIRSYDIHTLYTSVLSTDLLFSLIKAPFAMTAGRKDISQHTCFKSQNTKLHSFSNWGSWRERRLCAYSSLPLQTTTPPPHTPPAASSCSLLLLLWLVLRPTRAMRLCSTCSLQQLLPATNHHYVHGLRFSQSRLQSVSLTLGPRVHALFF